MFLLGRPAPGTPLHRVDHLLRWPLGVARVLAYRIPGYGPPLTRTEAAGDAGDLPVPVPPEVRADDVQYVADGTGALLHRCYSVVVDGADRGPEVLMAELSRDPNCAVPDAAVFQRTAGADGPMRLRDEWLIRMPAPWDGPVRVIGVTPSSFRFATLEGHLEAGQIEFRAAVRPDGALSFEIESWARPGDLAAHLLYNRLPLAKEIQLMVWARTCTAVAELVGGAPRDGVTAVTRVVDGPALDVLPPGV